MLLPVMLVDVLHAILETHVAQMEDTTTHLVLIAKTVILDVPHVLMRAPAKHVLKSII